MSGVRIPEARRPLAAVVAVVAVVALVFFDILFRGGVLFERDIMAHFWGQCESLANVVRAGAWPVWNPYLGFGQPMLANPGAQVLYPLTWLNLLVRPEDYYTVYAVGHLLLAGTGMLWLGRALRLSWAASTTAAAVWMLSGPLLSAVDLWQHFAGAAWMPWVVTGAGRALDRPSAGRVLTWALLQSAQVLTGSVDLVALTAVPQAFLVLGRLSWSRPLDGRNGRLLTASAGAAVLTVAWTAAVWLPAVQLLGRTSRGEPSQIGRLMWSARPVTLLQTLVPLFPHDLPLRESVRVFLYEGREPLLASLYLGLPALALVLAAFASARRRLAGAAALLVGLSLLLALGRHGLAYFWATATLPQLELLRYPVKATLLAAFGFAVLAAVGLEALCQGRLSRRAATAVATATGGAGTLALLAVRWLRGAGEGLLDPSRSSPEIPGALESALATATWSGAVALVVAGLFALAGRARAPRRTALAVAAVVVLDLLVAHRGLNPSVPRALVQATPRVIDILREDGARRVFVFGYLLRLAGTEPLRPDLPPELTRLDKSWRLLVESLVYPTAVQRWGLGGSYDFDIVGLDSRGRHGLHLLVLAAARDPGQLRRLLRVGGVGHVVALHREGLDALESVATVAHPVVGDVHVYRVPEPLPLVSAVAGTQVVTGHDRYKKLVDPAFDPRTTVILSDGAEARRPPEDFEWEVQVAEEMPDRLRLSSVTSAPAFLLLPEGYDEDWKATVDGRTTSVLRANIAFRAVPVPAGTHEVVLAYRPASVAWGLGISALSIAAALVAAGLRRRPGTGAARETPPPPTEAP